MAGYGGGYGNSGSNSGYGGQRSGNGSAGYGQGNSNSGGGSTGGLPRSGLDGFNPQSPYTSRIEVCGNYVMRFGKYKDMHLGEMANDPEALTYLDWLRSKDDFTGMSRDMVTIFLHLPPIAARLDEAIQARRAESKNRQ